LVLQSTHLAAEMPSSSFSGLSRDMLPFMKQLGQGIGRPLLRIAEDQTNSYLSIVSFVADNFFNPRSISLCMFSRAIFYFLNLGLDRFSLHIPTFGGIHQSSPIPSSLYR
jgi:hypothetical protein